MSDTIPAQMMPPTSAATAKVSAAFAKAQAAFGHAAKNATNPHFRSKYADLPAVLDACREPLAANDLSVVQRPVANERGIVVQTAIVHASGEWIADGGLFLPAAKLDPQGFGSAITYARRYGLAALLGIAQDDDDGNAASKPRATGATSFAQAPASAVARDGDSSLATHERVDTTPAAPQQHTQGDVFVWKGGKHDGQPITEIPDGYLKWWAGQCDVTDAKWGEANARKLAIVQAEQARRRQPSPDDAIPNLQAAFDASEVV